MNITYFNSRELLQAEDISFLAAFLHRELEEYGDSSDDITNAIRYALDKSSHKGGLIGVMSEGGQTIGVVVINRTGMEGYIPENLLVYVAIHHDHRGKGLGKRLLTAVLERIDGDVALHVEPSNPAVRLYQSIGFESRYTEMRLLRKEG